MKINIIIGGCMKILKITGIIAVVICIVVVSLLGYLGFFNKVSVFEKDSEKIVLIYEPFTGPYEKTKEAFLKVESYLKKEGLSSKKAAGIYYDNPAQVPSEKLRSECGFIINEKDYARLDALKGKYNIRTIEKGSFLYAEFPYKNVLSFMIGPMKVYPAFSNKIKENNNIPTYSIEIYDETSGVIQYFMPVAKK
jgi:hypothetical protein